MTRFDAQELRREGDKTGTLDKERERGKIKKRTTINEKKRIGSEIEIVEWEIFVVVGNVRE